MKQLLSSWMLICGLSCLGFGANITYELKSDNIELYQWNGFAPDGSPASGSERGVAIVLEYKGKTKEIECNIRNNVPVKDWIGFGRRFSAVVEDGVLERILRDERIFFNYHAWTDEFKSIKEIKPRTASKLKQKAESAPPGMVAIPSGTFLMGCTVGDMNCQYNETPKHRVRLRAFYVDKTEVTVGEYRKCVMVGSCSMPSNTRTLCNYAKTDREEHPINCADWQEANAYCIWAGKRLPSEAEWEYAARAGHSDWQYPWGYEDADCKRAVMDGMQFSCDRDGTAPVGSKAAYGFGLYDIAGNVDEWVQDCWHDDYIGAPTDGTAWTSGDCSHRVFRGGSWLSGWVEVRVTVRGPIPFDDPPEAKGFRCAKSAE